jgi:glycosyltransferase involved in cell wall biosynthesis
MPVSVVILTFDEADNIIRCLKALTWCDDIWVVDSNSRDGTATIAEAANAHVVRQSWLGFAGQRNFALDHLPLKHEWVLHLDADEFVTPDLAAELLAIGNGHLETKRVTAYAVPFQMLFMDRWLRHGGSYPNYQVRFGRKDGLRFVQVGHGQHERLIYGSLGRLRRCIYHFNFSKGIGPWISKHVVYARDEATQALKGSEEMIAYSAGLNVRTRLRRRIKYLTLNLPLRPVLRFVYMYVLRFGFLDGMAGFHYCLLVSIYDHFVTLQRRELIHGRDVFNESKVPA